MILWRNGPCGVGKSAPARALHRRRPDSSILDAGAVGSAVRVDPPPAPAKPPLPERPPA